MLTLDSASELGLAKHRDSRLFLVYNKCEICQQKHTPKHLSPLIQKHYLCHYLEMLSKCIAMLD